MVWNPFGQQDHFLVTPPAPLCLVMQQHQQYTTPHTLLWEIKEHLTDLIPDLFMKVGTKILDVNIINLKSG